MERGYWSWRGNSPYRYWRNTRPNDGWRVSYNQRYNYPNAWVPPQVRPPAGGQLVRGPWLQLHSRFPPAFGGGPQSVRQSTRHAQGVAQQRQSRNRRASSGELPGGGLAAGTSSAGLVNGRDSHATHSVRYVSDGQERQVELKVALLQIPKLCQRPPEEKGSSEKMAVSESPGQVPDKSNAVASKDEQAHKAEEKPKASTAVAKKTNHAAKKPGKLEASLVASSKLTPKSGPSEPMQSRASEATAILELPDHTSNAKESPNVVAKQTDHGALAKPNASSVTGSKPVLVQALQAQRKPVRSQASKMVPPDQAPKAEACPSNAMPKKTVRAPMSTEPKAFSVTGSKPILTRVSRTGQPTLPQEYSVSDSKPIPVQVSQGSAQAHHASLTAHKPALSQKKQSIGDELYEDVSDVPLEEYCDDPSNEASQVERAVVLGAGREEPQQPSCEKEIATQWSDFEDVSDTPLTLYHSPRKSGNPVMPAERHASEGAAKKPLGKKKAIGNTAAVKKNEEKKCAKAVEACHLPLQVAAKPKPVATNKVKAHLAEKQGAAKLTATTTAPNSNLGATKRLLEPPGTPHQDAKKRKVDTSSEKSKPDPCASTTQQNSSPSPGKKLAAKKIEKVVSCTEVRAKLPIAGSNDAEALNNSTMIASSTPQQNGRSLAVRKSEKVTRCSKVSTKPAMASSNSKEMSKDSPMPAPKLEASKAVVAKSKKSEPTSTKTPPKSDAGHHSVTTPTHKKDSAKRKSTSPRKVPATKRGKSTSPLKAAAMKLNKNPPTCADSKPKEKSHAPNGLPMTEDSPNPEGQTEAAAPAKRPPQPHSSKATAKGYALSSEATSTKEYSAMPAQHNVISKVPETQLGKDDSAQKARCSSTAETAPVCAPSSDVRPGSSLKQCHASKQKESSSEATKTHKLFGGPAARPSKQETEAKGTLGLVTDGQPRYISQEPADGMKERMTTPAQNRCLDVPKGSQPPSCDVLMDTNTPAVHEADHKSGMLPHGTNYQKSPPDNATLATGHCMSLGTRKRTSTFGSPLQESACNKPPLTQQSDDSSASVIRQVSGCEQPRKENPVPLDPPAIYEATKQGDGNESPSACDNFSAQKPVEGTDWSQEPSPSEDVDKRPDSTASTEESDEWTGEQSSPSPPRQTEANSPTTTVSSNGDAGDWKPDLHTEGPATSSHQDKVIKPRPPKKNKNKGPGTNTSMRSSWLFSRKKRSKQRRSSTNTPSGSSPKKLKAADTSQGSSSSSNSTREPSARPIKKEPANDVDTEAMLPSVAPPGHCSNKEWMSRAGQAFRSGGPKSTGSSTERFKAADPSQDVDSVAQGSSSRKLAGEPCTIAVKKEPGTEGVVDTEAIQNTPGKPCILSKLVSPAVHASDGSPRPAHMAKFPADGGKPSDPSSSFDSASAATPATPYETALMELDLFTGMSILDVCGSGTEMLAQLNEELQVPSITKKQALGMVQKAVHEAVLDEYLKREHADHALKLLAQVPFSLDHAKVAKIEQLTQAIVAMSEAGSKL